MEHERAFLSFFQAGKEPRDAALAYASLRIFVFPLTEHTKVPLPNTHGFKDATTNTELIKQYWQVGSLNNIGIALPQSCMVVVDVDPRNGGEESFRELVKKHGPIPDTYTVRTGGGGWHYCYRVSPDFYEDTTPYGDNKKLAPGIDLLINGYVVAPPSEVQGNLYAIDSGSPEFEFATLPFAWLDEVIANKQQDEYDSGWQHDNDTFTIDSGERNNSLTSLAGHLRNLYLNERDIVEILHTVAENHVTDYDNDTKREIPIIARSICKHIPKGIPFYDREVRLRKRVHKPILNKELALHGPIGRWVKLTLEHSEAHPAALLTQALTVFGNMIGAREYGFEAPGFTAEGAHHTTALYTLIIGESAIAAKGDSLSQVLRFLVPLDPEWPHKSGVQTGEAITKVLADDVETGEVATVRHGDQVDKKLHKLKGGQPDRRLCVIEDEFGRVLHVAKRAGSTIKDLYKSMWDSGSAEHITAAEQRKVTDATLSFIGHVTPYELRNDTTDGDFLNGYMNRFLLVHSERTQTLLEAQGLPERKLATLRKELYWALQFARDDAPFEYEFSKDALELLVEIHQKWTQPIADPIVSAMRSRARPNIKRLAIIYAVSCSHDLIEVADLEAAEAVYQYHFDTTEYLFSQFIGNQNAEKLYQALLANAAGLTKSEVYNEIFKRGRHAKAQASEAMDILISRGIAVMVEIHKPGSRKPSSVIRLAQIL
jgi:hypothetical protein